MATKLLEVGSSAPLHVREEHVTTVSDPCRVLYVSDIHLRKSRSERIAAQVTSCVKSTAADVVLLGGDLVDQATELGELTDLVRNLCDTAPVLAVGGNHDGHVGMSRVRDAVVAGGGIWIQNGSYSMPHRHRRVVFCGPECTPAVDGDIRILCAHNPRIWKVACRQGYDLVLAGHLHGCQFVAFEFHNRLYPGAWFYPYCYLNHHLGGTRLVVSRGVSDLVPIRWRCPREVVMCYV